MPIAAVNGTQLYYEAYGQDHPGRAPVVLIHGSTSTGQADWAAVAPLLAREYRVIVPDCRGHGRSPNPNHSYSFAEMAADTAGLIRALGYARAHVIGHSNGGNVALVALLEHPDVIQTCLPQAANAFVSPDLIEKEPAVFDPERVARAAPAWRAEMIRLHGETHGPDYWRELLALTLRAIVSEPNYTAADLARVERPVLVIQGEHDHVNAPAGHAQFIARHIPHAELWLAPGVDHNVHLDRPLEWLARVLDFLRRRGDDTNERLHRLRQTRYRDGRLTHFAVRAEAGVLAGTVLTPDQREAALAAAPGQADQLTVWLTEQTPWALVNRNVVDVRREPRRLSERLSQAQIGEAVRVLETGDDYSRVRVERDGYLGWMPNAALHRCPADEARRYRQSDPVAVRAGLAPAWDAAEGGAGVGLLPFGALLPRVDARAGRVALRLPAGAVWWVAAEDVLPAAERPAPDAAGRTQTLALLKRFVGVPYLWGGFSPFGYDCSGLAQTLWAWLGLALPRDADQQCAAGRPVDGPPQAGDLLFFGERPEDGDDLRSGITHVALALDAADVLHSAGSANGVTVNSLDPERPAYNAWLREHCLAVRRYA